MILKMIRADNEKCKTKGTKGFRKGCFTSFWEERVFATCVNESQCWDQYVIGWGKLVRMCRTFWCMVEIVSYFKTLAHVSPLSCLQWQCTWGSSDNLAHASEGKICTICALQNHPDTGNEAKSLFSSLSTYFSFIHGDIISVYIMELNDRMTSK